MNRTLSSPLKRSLQSGSACQEHYEHFLLNKGIFYLIQPLAKHFCQNIPASNLMENLYIPPAQRVREREKDRVVHSRSETHLKTL